MTTANPTRETVLIAEDEPLVRLLTKKVLEHAGYRVLVASSGAEALAIAGAFADPIDLLLTDVVMPQMNGRDLARELGKVRPGMQVLFMSGYSEDAVARQDTLDPGTVLIQKPFTPAALASTVGDMLNRQLRSDAARP
jgi:CheY-like chemotaxis protein